MEGRGSVIVGRTDDKDDLARRAVSRTWLWHADAQTFCWLLTCESHLMCPHDLLRIPRLSTLSRDSASLSVVSSLSGFPMGAVITAIDLDYMRMVSWAVDLVLEISVGHAQSAPTMHRPCCNTERGMQLDSAETGPSPGSMSYSIFPFLSFQLIIHILM